MGTLVRHCFFHTFCLLANWEYRGRHFDKKCSSTLVYDLNHYFGLGPIPKQENLNWPILSADTLTNTETTFQWKNLVTNTMGYFFIIKGPLKPNFLENITYFWKSGFIFKLIKTYIPPRIGPKLDLDFGSRYRNLVLVVH